MNTGLNWIDLAVSFIGTKEIPGPANNKQILEFLKGVSSDEDTPWCAAFVNYCLSHSGHLGSGSAMARSFETSKNFTHIKTYTPGAVVTRWRTSVASGSGHVGFAVGQKKGFVAFLGGNQGDSVSVSWQPVEFITGYHWPINTPVTPLAVDLQSKFASAANGDTKMV